jgi:hypothetical protein
MAGYPHSEVSSVRDLLDAVERDTKDWKCVGHVRPWFRGQSDASKPPIPSVLRTITTTNGVFSYDEFHMTTMFRLKAPAFGNVPETGRLDQWLFLMQHYGLPTRLLDWTENPLAACFFASSGAIKRRSQDKKFLGVWVLHPIELNRLTDSRWDDFLNTWTQGRCLENFKIAFGTAGKDKISQPEGGYRIFQPTSYPLAVQPSTVAVRVAVQRSCFTVHGRDSRDFEALFKSEPRATCHLKKYVFPREKADSLVRELERMGISDSTLHPDFDGLARELDRRFLLKKP